MCCSGHVLVPRSVGAARVRPRGRRIVALKGPVGIGWGIITARSS